MYFEIQAPLPQLDSISKSNEEWQIEKQDEDDDYDSGGI